MLDSQRQGGWTNAAPRRAARSGNRHGADVASRPVAAISVVSVRCPDWLSKAAVGDVRAGAAQVWKDLDAALREIARVLKPRAPLALILRTEADADAVSRFPAEVYRFRPLDEVLAALSGAGLDPEIVDRAPNPPS